MKYTFSDLSVGQTEQPTYFGIYINDVYNEHTVYPVVRDSLKVKAFYKNAYGRNVEQTFYSELFFKYFFDTEAEALEQLIVFLSIKHADSITKINERIKELQSEL